MNYRYLALGDSYTIGEGVEFHQNFPNQTARLLAQQGLSVKPIVVAKTGWTTSELQAGIAASALEEKYDIVSLLIGVNNQYRGEEPDVYAQQFEELLNQSIRFASDNPANVFVLSIPDWSSTPYAEGRNRDQISKEIHSFNLINKRVAQQEKVNYIDITGSQRAVEDLSLVAPDGLHPSEKEYRRWAEKLAQAIQKQLK